MADSVADRVRRAMEIADAQLDAGSATSRGGRRRRRQPCACARRCATVAASAGYQLHVPPPALCTDNAAMVAWAGAERLARGWTDGLDLEAARTLAARSRRRRRRWVQASMGRTAHLSSGHAGERRSASGTM